jgi:hypothetical protein
LDSGHSDFETFGILKGFGEEGIDLREILGI